MDISLKTNPQSLKVWKQGPKLVLQDIWLKIATVSRQGPYRIQPTICGYCPQSFQSQIQYIMFVSGILEQ